MRRCNCAPAFQKLFTNNLTTVMIRRIDRNNITIIYKVPFPLPKWSYENRSILVGLPGGGGPCRRLEGRRRATAPL